MPARAYRTVDIPSPRLHMKRLNGFVQEYWNVCRLLIHERSSLSSAIW